ncbi:MAG: LysM peptidoglycan-binding domain-containing protein [Thermoguttaceae bacterium]|nr:LysM peptidoglycan-binding domain-containing protein [Thermoguttaceae bacterium]
MFEKMFKGMFVLTVWGFILIAVAALLPDSAWESFPEKLLPVRDFLAEKNIISSQFRPENRKNNDLAKKNAPANSLPAAPQTDLSVPKKTQDTPSQSFTGVSSTDQAARTAQTTQNANAGDSKLDIPPFPTEAATAALDKNRVSLAQSSLQTQSQDLSPNNSAKSTDTRTALNVPDAASALSPKADTMASTPESEAKKSANDTLPQLSFDSTSPLANTSSTQTLSIDTTALSVPGANTKKAATTGLPSPVAETAKSSEPEKPIGNATLPDTGIISTTSATNASVPPFPSLNHLNLNSPDTTAATPASPATAAQPAVAQAAVPPIPASPVPADPTLPSIPAPQPVSTSPAAVAPTAASTQIPVAPLVNPSQELVQALVLSRNPNETKTAFFKLNQLLERYSDTYSAMELEQLHKALDRLAFTVFYDPKQHVLEPEYVTSAGETLASIAGAYKITPEHLAALNGLADPNIALVPGTKLKVVRGPVSANISMSKKELLLLYDGLYAGRFKMGYAVNAKALRGILSVTRKIASPQYIGPLENGAQGEIAGGDPRNPLGPFWIELNNGLGLQGTNHPEFVGNETAQQGGLIFSNKDITHLNILLPQGANIYLKD